MHGNFCEIFTMACLVEETMFNVFGVPRIGIQIRDFFSFSIALQVESFGC